MGGKVEPGETPADAAVREAAEEAGVDVVADGEIGRRIHPVTGRLIVYISCAPAASGAEPVVAEDEITEARWVRLDELDELMPDLYPPVREHLRNRQPDR